MRAAAIFGLGSSALDLKPFQKISNASWHIGMPAQSSDADAILVFGGDGTVHRHLGRLVKLQLPVLVVPAGSGNDFARALGISRLRDSVEAWQRFAREEGKVRTIDLGVITALGSAEPTAEGMPDPAGLSVPGAQRYFCCVAGCGLDAEIARRANRLPRWLRSRGGYALSLPGVLTRFTPLPMKILLPRGDGRGDFAVHRSAPTVLAACCNTPVYGGGMRIAPRAKLDDGKLDVCHVRELDKWRLFCLFPTVYFGRHLSIPEVEYFPAERVRLETGKPLDVYADGEYVCQTPVEVGLVPGALRVIVP